MNRKFGRYSRGGILLDLQNQKNHYKNLLEPRKSLHISQDFKQKLNFSLNQNNKYEKQLTKLRYQENQRLYKVLCNIKGTKGTIQLMQSRAKQQQKNKRKSTLNSQFKILQRKKQLRQDNKRIVNLIGHVKPRIGTITEWQEHYSNVEKQKRKISKAYQHVFDAQTLVTSKDLDLKIFFRETYDFSQSNNSKDKSRKNKTLSKLRKRKLGNNANKNQGTGDLNQEQLNILKQQGKVDQQDKIYQQEKFQSEEKNTNNNKQKVLIQENKTSNK